MHTTTSLRFGALFLTALSAWAGNFTSDFNSGLPPGAKVFGAAKIDDKEGVDNSGVLKVTEARSSLIGTFTLNPLDGNQPVAGFEATFKALIGNGSGADGIAFFFHPDFPNEAFTEKAVDGGLTIVFDTYKNVPNQVAPSVRVYAGKREVGVQRVPDLRKHKFVDVSISLEENGTLNLSYDHQVIFTNLQVGTFKDARRFAFCARTGSRDDEHYVDDLTITTHTASNPFVQSHEPTGDNVGLSPRIALTLRDHPTRIKTSSIRLRLDGKEVSPVVETGDMKIQVSYEVSKLLAPGSEHMVELAFADDGPAAKINLFSYSFTVTTQVQLSK